MATKRFKKLPKKAQRAAFAQMDESGTRKLKPSEKRYNPPSVAIQLKRKIAAGDLALIGDKNPVISTYAKGKASITKTSEKQDELIRRFNNSRK